jgi:hypothetical protein
MFPRCTGGKDGAVTVNNPSTPARFRRRRPIASCWSNASRGLRRLRRRCSATRAGVIPPEVRRQIRFDPTERRRPGRGLPGPQLARRRPHPARCWRRRRGSPARHPLTVQQCAGAHARARHSGRSVIWLSPEPAPGLTGGQAQRHAGRLVPRHRGDAFCRGPAARNRNRRGSCRSPRAGIVSELQMRGRARAREALRSIVIRLPIEPDSSVTTCHAGHAHSITSSARARIDCGTVRPSALAVLILMTSSNVVGRWTGRSAGLAPFRILPT